MTDINQLLKEFKALESSDLLVQLLQLVIWALFILFVAWLTRKGINKRLTDNMMRYRARKVVRFSSYGLIMLLAIVTFTGKVQYFTVAIGLISAGIAFAMREVILAIGGWIAISASNVYKPGDRIELNGIKGDVIDIGVTRTTLMEIGEWVHGDNYNGRIVQLSNALVFKEAVFNYSTDFPFVWDELILPVRYGSDVKLTNELILSTGNELLSDYTKYADERWGKMVRKYLIDKARVEPSVTLVLTDNWIEFTLRYVVDYRKRRSTRDELFKNIMNAIDATDGKVMLGSATFEVVGLPELKVNTSSG